MASVRNGHVAVGHDWLLNGVELNHRTTDCREHPQSAYCRPTKAKFRHEISVNQTVVLLTLKNHARHASLGVVGFVQVDDFLRCER
jgi:hypothetical protein